MNTLHYYLSFLKFLKIGRVFVGNNNTYIIVRGSEYNFYFSHKDFTEADRVLIVFNESGEIVEEIEQTS